MTGAFLLKSTGWVEMIALLICLLRAAARRCLGFCPGSVYSGTSPEMGISPGISIVSPNYNACSGTPGE